MENTTQDLTDIKEALTWLQIRARLNTENSAASDVEVKSRNDSNDNGFATPSDSIDEPNEDQDSLVSRLHTNSTKKAPRNEGKHMRKDNKVNPLNLPNTKQTCVLTKHPKSTESLAERLKTIAQEYPKIAQRTKLYPTSVNSKQFKFTDTVLIKEPTDVNRHRVYVIVHTAEHCRVVFEPLTLSVRNLHVDMIHNEHIIIESKLLYYFQKQH